MTNTPDETRLFQLTDLENNNNKWWKVEIWNQPSTMPLVRVTFGRVGAKPPSTAVAKPKSRAELAELIASKERKGYREVLVTRDGHITATQIADGRALLDRAVRAYRTQSWAALLATVERYCTTIPTQLPARIDPQDVARMLAVNVAAQRVRLDQFAQALIGNAPVAAPQRALPQRAPLNAQALGHERAARTGDWATRWLTGDDALRAERAGISLPQFDLVSTDAERSGREDTFDLRTLVGLFGNDDLREQRTA